MSTENFETYAQGNLENHRSTIDAEALWAAIEPVLHPEKKRRSFFWIWMLAGLGLSAAIFYFSASSNPTTESSTPISSVNESTAVSNQTAAQKTSPQPITTTASASSIARPENNDQTLSNTKSNVERQSISKPSTVSSTQKNIVASPSAIPVQTPPTTKALITQTPAAAKDPIQTIASLALENTIDHSDQDESTTAENETKATAVIENVAPPKSDVKEIEIAEPIKEAMVEEITEEVEEKKPEVKPPPPPPSFSSRFAFGFGARTGISSMITDFTADTASVGEAIRVLREGSETKLETLDFGLEVLLKSKKTGFYAATGVDYQRGARRLNFDDVQESVDSTEGIVAIYVNPITGDSTKEYGMVAITTTTMNVKEIFNYIHFVNIPVSIGYAFKYDNWSFGVEAGASFNILTKYKGQLMRGANDYYDIKEDELKWFKQNVGPSFRGSMQIGYSPTENFQIVAGPSFRSFVTVSTGDNPLQQRQASLGFQVAARYWLDY